MSITTATVLAQRRPPAPQKPPTTSTPVVQMPTFHASDSAVSKDVYVHDANTNEFVPDLKKDEFVVLEDGVQQKIESMTLVVGGRALQDSAPLAAAVPEGFILPPPPAAPSAPGRVFLIFIDDANIVPSLTPQLRQLLGDIQKNLIHEGDEFGIVSTGPSSIAIDMQYDHARMKEAIDKAAGDGMKPEDIVEASQTADGPAGLRYQAKTAFSTAYDILSRIGAITNRRKAFIYISSGYDFNPFPNGREKYVNDTYGSGPADTSTTTNPNGSVTSTPNATYTNNPFLTQQSEFSEGDLVQELSELTRAANRSNTLIYTIDPRGLNAGPDINQNYVDTSEWRDYTNNTVDSLRVLADLTGGIAIVNQNDLVKGLKKIDGLMSDYYVLGYHSSNPDPLRRVRKVEIKINRAGKRPEDFLLDYVHQYGLAPPGKGGH